MPRLNLVLLSILFTGLAAGPMPLAAYPKEDASITSNSNNDPVVQFDGSKPITVHGFSVYVGNAPWVELIIRDDNNIDWYIPRDEQKKITRIQQKLTITGLPSRIEMKLAGENPKTVYKYTLSGINVVSYDSR
jgi:hypothetical protein